MDDKKCDKCGKNFKTLNGLIYHIANNSCRDISELCEECDICGLKYKSKNSLRNHMRNKHKDEYENSKNKDNKCYLCGTIFSNKYNLKRHAEKNCSVRKTIINNNTNNYGNVHYGDVNNITNNNNINIELNLANFTEEKLGNINQEKIIELVENTSSENIRDLPIDYLKLKHIDTEEHRNLYIDNKFSDKAYIFIKKWIEIGLERLVAILKSKAIEDIDAIISIHQVKYKDLIDTLLTKMDNFSNTQLHKELNSRIKDIFYKNRDILKLKYLD